MVIEYIFYTKMSTKFNKKDFSDKFIASINKTYIKFILGNEHNLVDLFFLYVKARGRQQYSP